MIAVLATVAVITAAMWLAALARLGEARSEIARLVERQDLIGQLFVLGGPADPAPRRQGRPAEATQTPGGTR